MQWREPQWRSRREGSWFVCICPCTRALRLEGLGSLIIVAQRAEGYRLYPEIASRICQNSYNMDLLRQDFLCWEIHGCRSNLEDAQARDRQ